MAKTRRTGAAAPARAARATRQRPAKGNGKRDRPVLESASAKPAARRLMPLHILSDSTGNLAQHMLIAFLTQFPSDAFVLRPQNFLQSPQRIESALLQVAEEPGIVFHAVVAPDAKAAIVRRCEELGVPHCDLTGPFVQFLARQSGVEPMSDVHRLHDTSSEYHERIRALEFTLEHDDGLGLDTIHRAEIVLAGVSRTSKTPTSIYLAQQGYRVANVSLAVGVEPPAQLLALKRNIVGLVINPSQLVEIRTNRQVGWRMSDSRYNDPREVGQEVAWSRRLFASQGWPVLDVTDQAVEETAAKIVNLVNARTRGGSQT